jgi:hypothetical protein
MTLRIVSKQSEVEIRRQQALKQLTREPRRFAANFLRLVGGSNNDDEHGSHRAHVRCDGRGWPLTPLRA